MSISHVGMILEFTNLVWLSSVSCRARTFCTAARNSRRRAFLLHGSVASRIRVVSKTFKDRPICIVDTIGSDFLGG